MKKFAGIFLSVALISSLFSSCGNTTETTDTNQSEDTSTASTEENSEENSTKDTEEIKNIIIWGGVPEESGPLELVNSWNELHPNTPAEYIRFTNDDTGNTKLDTAILSGEQIDLFFTYASDRLSLRTDGGMTEALEPYGVEDFINENLIGGTDSVMKVNGGIYAIPTAKEVDFYMVNQNMLDESGVVINAGWDVDEFSEIAATLTTEKDGKKVYGTHAYYGGNPLNFAKSVLGPDIFYNEDGTASNFDAPEFQNNIKTKALMDNGYSMSFEEIFSRQFGAYCHPAFLNEEVAMMAASSWMIRYVLDTENYPHTFKTAFAPVPTTEKGVENNYQGTLNNFLSICSNSENKEESWEFMKYWLTDGSEFMLAGGKIPVWNQVDEELVVEKVLGENAEEMFDVQSFKDVVFNEEMEYILDTRTNALPEISQIYKEESEMYFLGTIDAETYFSNLKERSDAAILAAQ